MSQDRFEDYVPIEDRWMAVAPERILVQAGLAKTKAGKEILKAFKKGKIKAPEAAPPKDHRAQREYKHW